MTLEVWTDSKIQKCILKKFVKKENGLHGESKNLKYIFVQRIKGSKRIFMFYSIKIPFLIWIGRMFWKNVVISNSICLKNLIKVWVHKYLLFPRFLTKSDSSSVRWLDERYFARYILYLAFWFFTSYFSFASKQSTDNNFLSIIHSKSVSFFFRCHLSTSNLVFHSTIRPLTPCVIEGCKFYCCIQNLTLALQTGAKPQNYAPSQRRLNSRKNCQ